MRAPVATTAGGRRLEVALTELHGREVSKSAAADLIERLERFRETAWQNTRG